MTVQVILNTPLADALSAAIQPKLVEAGWASGSDDDAALVEYIILMLVNGRTQEQIATELSADLLGLGPDDPAAMEFAAWLFQQADQLNAQLNGPQSTGDDANMTQGTGDFDTDMGANDTNELNAPTGPRSMRNGPNPRGRDKRMLGHMTKAMDRSGDSVLHRVRGNDRVNSHARGPPTGPRGGGIGRGGRPMNNRGVNIQAGLNAMAGMAGPHGGPPGMNGMNGPWGMPGQGMPGQQPTQMDLMAMMEQQAQMMSQLQQQLMNQSGGGRRGGKSLFDRTQNSRGNFRNRQHQPRDKQDSTMAEGGAEGDDVEMSQSKREPPNPDETVCKYNLHCTNRDCKFAHQSPAAPPGTTVDISDVCTFGAACKNRKCVGRHPSPAARLAHQSEQDCKFFPNCTNPRCPFKHPEMPLCRNGAGCTTPGCKFTHVKVKCRFNPCKNPHCVYTHEEGQQGVFKDKVWTADGENHVSERQFVGSNAEEEVILPDNQEQNNAPEVIS
ncbi:Nuclear polyadenylated RNA-binding protein NAB2 [Colletotrichum chlorophyti]|uniref:Nuclear polyadenylated RNA-binding protein NAB2 n=1 Tax=Colletotrichum chlorophyti TaxID=708187 RepID=A0A1Q8RUR3_9PEZI|nr:Nuclear polyadenylated RNA-binding protein NAB2 [Colletotrichum chlorophyti]